jgi:cation transport ATPase
LQDRIQQEGKTAVLVSADSKVIGAIGLLDMAKQGAKEAVAPASRLGSSQSCSQATTKGLPKK